MSTATARASSVLLTVLVLGATHASAQNRLGIPPGGTNRTTQHGLVAGLVTSDLATGGQTPTSLVQALVGTGVTISNVQYSGASIAAGTFSGGTGIIGFAQGVVLGSGDVGSVAGPQNLSASTSTDNALPGDPDLDALVNGATQDATVLEFDFECPTATVISFQYVFTSEEYDEWVNTAYNDVFAFILNGQNIALIPGTTTPVAINNVNCGNPWSPPGGANCALYTTNSCDSMGLGYPCTLLATEMDGVTSVFSVTGTLQPGPNHIKLAIADRGDGVYDSNVFVRGESFVCGPAVPAFDPPSPCGQTLVIAAGAQLAFEIDALATNGFAGEAVTLDCTGDPTALGAGTFVPPLPLGPAPSVTTEFHWQPVAADVGSHVLHFVATDQLGQVGTCDVTIEVIGSTGAFCPGDGSTIACPCGNDGNTGRGCANSLFNGGGRLRSAGGPSVSADDFVLHGESMTGNACIFFQGDAQMPPVIVDDGIGCVSGTVLRIATKAIAGNAAEYPQGAEIPISVRGQIPAMGGTRYYQCFYRNAAAAFCPPATSNRTNGLAITWSP